MTLGLYGMVSLATFTDRALMMGALLGVLPVIVIFLGLQRYWQSGLAAGASRADVSPAMCGRKPRTAARHDVSLSAGRYGHHLDQ